jgi:hypothetical protein
MPIRNRIFRASNSFSFECGIVALTAQTQQSSSRLRQIEFAAAHVVAGLSIWNLKELGRGTQLLPQFSRAGIGMARFPRHEAF